MSGTPTVDALIASLVRPEVLAERAYAVADPRGLVKLDAMENPYGWPPGVRAEWLRRLESVTVNRYPVPDPADLKRDLAAAWGLPEAAHLLLGNGSDELIQILFHAVAGTGRPVLVLEPSFAMYRITARHVGVAVVEVALGEDFAFPEAALGEALRAQRPALAMIASPNNPTGNRFASEALARVVADAPETLVVVDEAYAPFARENLATRVGTAPNLLLLRTLSKMGLAGLRLGALAGPAPWIEVLNRLRLPYNVNTLTQVTAELALEHYPAYLEQVAAIRAERERLYTRLCALEGVRVWPSETNFLLVRVAGGGGACAEALRRAGVLVKDLHGSAPRLADCLRVSIGLPAENDAFHEALCAYLAGRA